MKLGMAALASLALGAACDPRGDVEIERRHYGRPANDGAIVASVNEVSLTLDPVFHARTDRVSATSITTRWFATIEASSPLSSVESVADESAPLGHVANVDGGRFDLVLVEPELRAALVGAPVVMTLRLDTGDEIVVSLDVRASFLHRTSSGPYVLAPVMKPSDTSELLFDATLDGPDIASLEVIAAAPPTVSDEADGWHARWGFDDLLRSAAWRNGAVDLRIHDASGGAFDASATLAPAIHRVHVTVAE